MDKNKTIYLTAKISVVEGNDILAMTMKSVQVANKVNQSSTNMDEDDDSEDEVPGEILMHTYKHFYNVHKDNKANNVEEIKETDIVDGE